MCLAVAAEIMNLKDELNAEVEVEGVTMSKEGLTVTTVGEVVNISTTTYFFNLSLRIILKQVAEFYH